MSKESHGRQGVGAARSMADATRNPNSLANFGEGGTFAGCYGDSGATTPLGNQAQATYALFDRLGFGGKDFSGILQMLRGNLASLKA
mgnify:CR=1 FL=1